MESPAKRRENGGEKKDELVLRVKTCVWKPVYATAPSRAGFQVTGPAWNWVTLHCVSKKDRTKNY